MSGLLKGTGRMLGRVATGGWNVLGSLGTHWKGALVGTGIVYGGWQKLATGKYPGQELAEGVYDTTKEGVDLMGKGVHAANTVADYVNDGLEKAPDVVRDVKNVFTGGDSAGGEGQSGGLLGNLFGGIKNLVGGLFGGGGTGSMLGLVAGAFLLFGGFGWMGKIAGALLAALSLGLFGNNSQQQQVQQAPVRQKSRAEAFYPNMDMDGQIDNSNTIHRSR